MAEKGDVGAQFSLARVYYDGSRSVPRNFGRALFYFGSVARQHWSREGKVLGAGKDGGGQGRGLFGAAASYLGLMHMRGEGVPQSFDKAKIWFQRGVDLVLALEPPPLLVLVLTVDVGRCDCPVWDGDVTFTWRGGRP